jgi:hypothetical protein
MWSKLVNKLPLLLTAVGGIAIFSNALSKPAVASDSLVSLERSCRSLGGKNFVFNLNTSTFGLPIDVDTRSKIRFTRTNNAIDLSTIRPGQVLSIPLNEKQQPPKNASFDKIEFVSVYPKHPVTGLGPVRLQILSAKEPFIWACFIPE